MRLIYWFVRGLLELAWTGAAIVTLASFGMAGLLVQAVLPRRRTIWPVD